MFQFLRVPPNVSYGSLISNTLWKVLSPIRKSLILAYFTAPQSIGVVLASYQGIHTYSLTVG